MSEKIIKNIAITLGIALFGWYAFEVNELRIEAKLVAEYKILQAEILANEELAELKRMEEEQQLDKELKAEEDRLEQERLNEELRIEEEALEAEQAFLILELEELEKKEAEAKAKAEAEALAKQQEKKDDSVNNDNIGIFVEDKKPSISLNSDPSVDAPPEEYTFESGQIIGGIVIGGSGAGTNYEPVE